jgi:hypothetical protein
MRVRCENTLSGGWSDEKGTAFDHPSYVFCVDYLAGIAMNARGRDIEGMLGLWVPLGIFFTVM